MLSYHVVGAKVDDSGKVEMCYANCTDKAALHSILKNAIDGGYCVRVYYGEEVLIADDLSGVKWGGSVVSFNNKEPEYVEMLTGG